MMYGRTKVLRYNSYRYGRTKVLRYNSDSRGAGL